MTAAFLDHVKNEIIKLLGVPKEIMAEESNSSWGGLGLGREALMRLTERVVQLEARHLKEERANTFVFYYDYIDASNYEGIEFYRGKDYLEIRQIYAGVGSKRELEDQHVAQHMDEALQKYAEWRFRQNDLRLQRESRRPRRSRGRQVE